jgi:hypothetical protein
MLASSFNLFGPDTIMLFMIGAFLAVPIAIVIFIVVLVKSRKGPPPPGNG